MCSGVLLLDTKKSLPVKKIYRNYIWRILKALIIWSILYKVYRISADGSISPAEIKNILKETILFDHEFHLYYLHIMLIIYIMLPLTKIITENSSKNLLMYIIAVWFVFAIVYPTVRNVYPLSILKGIPLQWLINMTYGSIGYTILGYYINKYPLGVKSSVGLSVIGFLITFVGTYVISDISGTFYNGLLEGMSVGVCLYSAGLFSLLQRAEKKPENIFGTFVTSLSESSFFIYLFHVFLIYTMTRHKIDLYIFPIIISIPLISGAIMLISMSVYVFYCKITRKQK